MGDWWAGSGVILVQAVAPRQWVRYPGTHFSDSEMGLPPLLESKEGTPRSYWQIVHGLKLGKWAATGKTVNNTQQEL